MEKEDLFVKLPNYLLKADIEDKFHIHRVLLVVYFLIGRNRTYEGKSFLTAGEVLDFCGYACTKKKPRVFDYVMQSLTFLYANGYIRVGTDAFLQAGYKDCIFISLEEKFDVKEDFTVFTFAEMDKIAGYSCRIHKEKIVSVYLYMKAYMFQREDFPSAFFGSISVMSKTLHISKKEIESCIHLLLQGSKPLLRRQKVCGEEKKQPPHIYVLGREGYKEEIKKAVDYLGVSPA